MRIGIFAIYQKAFDEKSIGFPLGGSETWAIQLSEAFRSLGHDVFVVCYCAKSHVSESGIRYISIKDFANYGGWKFDFVIISRYLSNFLRLWHGRGTAQRMFLQLHDDTSPDLQQVTDFEQIDRVIVLTDWHRRYISEKYQLNEDRMAVIPNPVDTSLFPDIDVQRRSPDHSILWSSCPSRGLIILDKLIAPLVKKIIPDFKIQAVTYNLAEQQRYDSSGDVEWLKPMNKKQLYAEMCKHAVWFYPSVFNETFCITAAENAYAGNHLVMHPEFGTTAFEKIADNIIAPFWNKFTCNQACVTAAAIIVDRVLNYGKYENAVRRVAARRFVEENFSPLTIARTYINMYGEIAV